MSELNISLIFVGDKNKGEYISSEQVVKYEVEACINYQAVNDKTNQLVRGCTCIQEKNNIFYLKRKGLPRLLNRGYVVGLRSSAKG